MARVYADETAYVEWTGQPAPDRLDTLLRMASRAVDALLIARAYPTDADGYPTDPDHAQDMADATCAIAQAFDQAGLLAGGGASALEWDSVAIGGVSLSGRREGASSSVTYAGVTLPPSALISLSGVGEVVVWS